MQLWFGGPSVPQPTKAPASGEEGAEKKNEELADYASPPEPIELTVRTDNGRVENAEIHAMLAPPLSNRTGEQNLFARVDSLVEATYWYVSLTPTKNKTAAGDSKSPGDPVPQMRRAAREILARHVEKRAAAANVARVQRAKRFTQKSCGQCGIRIASARVPGPCDLIFWLEDYPGAGHLRHLGCSVGRIIVSDHHLPLTANFRHGHPQVRKSHRKELFLIVGRNNNCVAAFHSTHGVTQGLGNQ